MTFLEILTMTVKFLHSTFLLTTMALLMSACGGAPQDNPNYNGSGNSNGGTSSSSSSSSSSTSSSGGDIPLTGTPDNGYLNCNALDPGRVYFHGTIGTDTNQKAIGDPLNPSSVCVSSPSRHGKISASGRYLHQIGAFEGERITPNYLGEAVAEFTQDDLFLDSNGNWDYSYPNTYPTQNDNVLYIADDSALAITKIIPHPSNANDLVYLYFSDMYSPDGQLFHAIDNSNSTALAMLEDGSVVVGERSALNIVDRSGIVTPVTLPDGMSTNWQVIGKHHPGGIWILTGAFQNERWTLSTDLQLTLDGEYAARPTELADVIFATSRAFDGAGNLWEYFYNSGNDGMIIRRPLEGEGESEVVYRSSNGPGGDWTTNPSLYIYPYLDASLITGP